MEMVKGGKFIFNEKKMVKKRYYRSEVLVLAWDHIGVR